MQGRNRWRQALCGLACLAAVACRSVPGPDPWQGFNRGVFAFNETADKWVIEPVAKGWDFVAPDPVQTGVQNFFDNLRAPQHVLNCFLQGKLRAGYLQIWRFVLNTGFGFAGFLDVADWAGWPDDPEDFGLTLGHWGVPNGPYLVLPILGPSTVRDTVGLGADSMTSAYSYFVPIYVPIAARAFDLLNTRAIYLEEIEQSRQEAFDFYVFVRNAYLQHREYLLTGVPEKPADEVTAPTSGDDEDLYYFDDEPDDQGGEGTNDDEGSD
jgi:phospholipid-binding lipoprotein MlaA